MNTVLTPRFLLKPLKRLCRWICRDEIWNAEMSLEVDRLVAENDRLRERIKVMEDASG